MSSFLRQVRLLLQKEFRLEWRSRERIAMMFFFAFLSLAVFGLALQLPPSVQKQVLPGILWVTLAFAGTLGMGRMYASELEDDALDGIRMSPVSREALFLSKQLSLFVFLLSCAIWAVPVSALMFQVELKEMIPGTLPFFLLGMWGFSILGSLMATVLLHSRFREALLPLLFLPVALPLLIAGARATGELLGVGGVPQPYFWWRAMLFFDVGFFVLGLWLFPIQFDG